MEKSNLIRCLKRAARKLGIPLPPPTIVQEDRRTKRNRSRGDKNRKAIKDSECT